MTRFAFFDITPQLSIRRVGDQVEIGFDAGRLESAPDLAGPWAEVATQPPLRVTSGGASGFYRVRQAP